MLESCSLFELFMVQTYQAVIRTWIWPPYASRHLFPIMQSTPFSVALLESRSTSLILKQSKPPQGMSTLRKMLMNVFHLWRKFTANENDPITIQTMTLYITKKKHHLVCQDMFIKPYIWKARAIFSGSLILGIQSWAQMTFTDRRRGKRVSTRLICNSITLLCHACFSTQPTLFPNFNEEPTWSSCDGMNSCRSHWAPIFHRLVTVACSGPVWETPGGQPWKGKSCLYVHCQME